MEKNPVKWFFSRCLHCLFPNYIWECSETCENLFDKVVSKPVSYKVITPETTDCSKSQYSKFVTTVVKENQRLFKGWPMFGPIYDEICLNICKIFCIMETLQDFTNTIAWSGSSQAWMQCQQKSACGKSTHNNFYCSMYHPRSHGLSWTWIK